MVDVAESVLAGLEEEHATGITSAALLAFFAEQQIRFGEATLRKWVQLGLLPRSVRVGQKGKHQGSKGKYPVRVVRQILRVKELMAKDMTIEEIQLQVLFVRGDIEALQQTLASIFGVFESKVETREGLGARGMAADITRARSMADDLVEKFEKVERALIAEHDAARDREAAAS